MSRKIVRAREDGVAWLASRRVYPLALVGAGLGVSDNPLADQTVRAGSGLAVSLALVLL